MNKFTDIFEIAYNLRKAVVEKDNLEAYRLYDRESDKLTEVAVDVYRDFAEIQVYAPMPDQKIFLVVEALFKDRGYKGIYIKDRTKNGCSNIKSGFLHGERHPEEFIFEESGFKYYVDLEKYLDTGVFLDARRVRKIIKKKASGKRVLNLFSYTATASLAAIAGKSNEVVSVDISNTYTEWAKRNYELNEFDVDGNPLIVQDVMSFVNSEKGKSGKYDLIIVDPPTFAHSKKGDFSIQRDHVRLLNDCISCLSFSGEIIFTTHYKDFKFQKDKIGARIDEITSDTLPFEYVRGDIHRAYKISQAARWEKVQSRIEYNKKKQGYKKEFHKRSRKESSKIKGKR